MHIGKAFRPVHHYTRRIVDHRSPSIQTNSSTYLVRQKSTHKMGKSDEDVVKEFGELVNMSASELEKWLKVCRMALSRA